MIPFIMSALSLAQRKAMNDQEQINQLNSGMQQPNMLLQNSNGLGNALSTISSVYGGLFGKK